MSQIKFNTTYKTKAVEVMAGWDNPLQGYFLSIFKLDLENDDEELLYDNLADKDLSSTMGFARSTGYFKTILEHFEIVVPDGFWERVERNERNVTHIFRNEQWALT